jgi:hypothetical protein
MAVLELDEELGAVTLSSTVSGPNRANLALTLAPVSVASQAVPGRVLRTSLGTEEAHLRSQATLGERPEHPVLPPTLHNLTGPVRSSGGAILCFVGPPWKTVEWRMIQGVGTLTPFTTYTDELGRASCRFDCGPVSTRTKVVIGVAYVP